MSHSHRGGVEKQSVPELACSAESSTEMCVGTGASCWLLASVCGEDSCVPEAVPMDMSHLSWYLGEAEEQSVQSSRYLSSHFFFSA